MQAPLPGIMVELTWWLASKRTNDLTNLGTTQTQIQAFELAQSKTYPIYELLEYMKGLALQNQGLHDSGQQQDIQTKPGRETRIDSVAEAISFKPDQWLIALKVCK